MKFEPDPKKHFQLDSHDNLLHPGMLGNAYVGMLAHVYKSKLLFGLIIVVYFACIIIFIQKIILDKLHDVNKVRSMGHLIKFPSTFDEQICMTPGNGRHTEGDRAVGGNKVVGKSTLLLNFTMRLLNNLQQIPDSTYFVAIGSLTSAGELIMCIMDRTGKQVRS